MFATNNTYATLFSLPATYATAFGFIFSYGKLIVSMAESKLLPKIFTLKYGPTQAPYVAQITGSIIGYCVCLIVYYYPPLSLSLFNICMLCG